MSLLNRHLQAVGATRGNVRSIELSALIFLCVAVTNCGAHGSAPEQRFDLKGTVVSVDVPNRRVTVNHEDIPGYMPGMTMPFSLKDETWLNILEPGDQVSATLVVSGSSSWLDNLVITKETTGPAPGTATEGLAEPGPGDEVPDVALTNQDGKRIHLGQYRGRTLLLTFIYTRCPLPEYCALMSDNFAEIDKELQKDPGLYQKTHLLTVSFDPEFDTPRVLRSYGAAHTGNYDRETFQHWEFATGSKEEVKGIAQFFGLRYFQDSDQIVHSLRTAVIGPDGRLVKLYRDNTWKPAEVLSNVKSGVDTVPSDTSRRD